MVFKRNSLITCTLRTSASNVKVRSYCDEFERLTDHLSEACLVLMNSGALSSKFLMLSDLVVACIDGMYLNPSDLYGNRAANLSNITRMRLQKQIKQKFVDAYGSSQSSEPFQCCIFAFGINACFVVWSPTADNRDSSKDAARCDGPSETSAIDECTFCWGTV